VRIGVTIGERVASSARARRIIGSRCETWEPFGDIIDGDVGG
jgi:hypothetical protein